MFMELSNSELYEINGGSIRDVCGVIGGVMGVVSGAIAGAALGLAGGAAISMHPVVALIGGGLGAVGAGYVGYYTGQAAAYDAYDTIVNLFN